ncbi:MAG: DUF2726 domain-containing protein, partial [Brachybacterium sp.]|nr:DUF2726 domain-containing protein [Brachybacterium sp.]
LDDTDLVVCLDALAGRWGTTESLPLESIRWQADLLSGRGSARVRRAAAQAVENVWSPMETRLRLLLVASGFPAGIANMQLVDPDTHQVFYLDIAYPRWRIAIEFDGDSHRTDRAQWQRDLHKNHVLHAAGWTVLRISSADLRDPQRFLRRLSAAITRAGKPRSG